MAFFYVPELDKNEIGKGLFGYARKFQGLQVSLFSKDGVRKAKKGNEFDTL